MGLRAIHTILNKQWLQIKYNISKKWQNQKVKWQKSEYPDDNKNNNSCRYKTND